VASTQPKEYRAVGDHQFDLSSGRIVAPGDKVPRSALDAESDHDKALVDEGRLLPIEPAKRED
jgi:hypothetical protein